MNVQLQVTGIYSHYHPCLSHDKVFAKLLTSKAVLGKRPLEVQVHGWFCHFELKQCF